MWKRDSYSAAIAAASVSGRREESEQCKCKNILLLGLGKSVLAHEGVIGEKNTTHKGAITAAFNGVAVIVHIFSLL